MSTECKKVRCSDCDMFYPCLHTHTKDCSQCYYDLKYAPRYDDIYKEGTKMLNSLASPDCTCLGVPPYTTDPNCPLHGEKS